MTRVTNERDGRCWGCGYLLRGLESGACPECGRKFDPADPSTINLGRTIGRLGWWMLAPVGARTIGVAAVGAALVAWTTRWSPEAWHFSLVDLRLYGRVGFVDVAPLRWGAIDMAYWAGLICGGLAALAWFARVAAWTTAMVFYRPPRSQRPPFWRRSLVAALLLCIVVAGIGIGWPYRLGQRWAREWEAVPGWGQGTRTPLFFEMGDDAAAPLAAIVLHGRTPRERRSGLKLLSETAVTCRPSPAPPSLDDLLRRAAESETEPENKALVLRLAGIHFWPGMEPVLESSLADPSPLIRTAAADGLGLYALGNRYSNNGAYSPNAVGEMIPGDPPIELSAVYGRAPVAPSLTTDARQRLEAMMLKGATPTEREAAARAVVNLPPPDYDLRYAEWGVLIGEGPRRAEFTRALLDDVPPFVPRIGNPASDFESRITRKGPPGGNGKPVVHLTADRPMAVDVEVCFNEGRPWVAYPAFDDLVLLKGWFGFPSGTWSTLPTPAERRQQSIRQLDPVGLPPAPTDLREGYPWMEPPHRTSQWYDPIGWNGGVSDPDKLATVSGIGVRWQSVVVTPPDVPPREPPAALPADGKYAWWGRLRDVPCSWVSSRGQSERFLYYDGPTALPLPEVVRLDGQTLRWQKGPHVNRPFDPELPHAAAAGADNDVVNTNERCGLYLEVSGGGRVVRGHWLGDTELASDGEVDLSPPPLPPLSPYDELPLRPVDPAEFTARLVRHGLAASEAAAMMSCWQAPFFKTDGKRMIVILSQGEYEAICPLTVRPWPTDLIRVGVVWTEFAK